MCEGPYLRQTGHMPLFRVNDKLHYYAHVPKCAGSAVADYLTTRCGPLAFQNTRFLMDLPEQRWTKSSPQHVDWASFTKLIPADWIASSFAVVRHPTARVISAYHFQRDVEETLPKDQSIDDWFASWADKTTPFIFDNHLLPQSAIVPPDATVFKIEDGLDAVIPYLDGIIGNNEGPRSIGAKNTQAKRRGKADAIPGRKMLDRIAEIYAVDFQRFDYPLELPEKPVTPTRSSGPISRILSKFRGAA